MSDKKPQTISELYEVLMGHFESTGRRFDFIDQQVVKLRQETNQGSIQVNQHLQDVLGRLDNLERRSRTPQPQLKRATP